MTETKFTPGPWKYEGSIYNHMGAGIRSIPDDRGIAQIWQHGNVVADAALISAAPDLYAIVAAFYMTGTQDAPAIAALQTAAGDVLAKALGETP